MGKNLEANRTQNENSNSAERMALEKQRLAAAVRQQADSHNETTHPTESNSQNEAKLENARRATPDELANMKIESEQKPIRHSSQEVALIKSLNETPESERRAWENAQFDRIRRLTPDELAKSKVDEGKDASTETHETSLEAKPEHVRLAAAAESIEKIDDLKPERWRELTPQRRTLALQQAGRSLRDAYDCPDPPLMPRDFPEYNDGKILLGFYQDGATLDHPNSDYVLRLNEKLLHHDDPSKALETYSHEFRHAYQSEMATRYEKPQFRNLVHDKDAAAKWSENFRAGSYKHPADDFDQYREQIVEKDAREFAKKLVNRIYEK
jgi:hypothetical protein